MQTPKWKYTASIYLKRKHVLIFRDNDLGLQLQVISRLSKPGASSQKLYFVDGDNRAYSTEAELIEASANGLDGSAAGTHPLYVECRPGATHTEHVSPHLTPSFPTLLQQGHRWILTLARRVTAQAAHAGYRFSLHRPSR